ncbi:MAG TPA: hypothetical protein DHW49_08435 [Anaerolineae bacterium]|nr:hypothetical protein [Anaerolineae bacterium]
MQNILSHHPKYKIKAAENGGLSGVLPNLNLWHRIYIFFTDGFSNYEQPAPTKVAIFFDAGL